LLARVVRFAFTDTMEVPGTQSGFLFFMPERILQEPLSTACAALAGPAFAPAPVMIFAFGLKMNAS
jgi:hypothetical protein